VDDELCRRYFLEPTQPLHRRYEVLRAFFVERRSQAEIAAQFGLTPATVQSLVRDFRAQLRDGQPSPFLSSPDSADPSAAPGKHPPRNRRHRR
jgi:helix-turn-helix protein